MLYQCKSGWNLRISSWDMVHTSTFWLKFGSLSPAVTLKIRSWSPKPTQLFNMSQCYIHANLVKIHPPVHEAVTLKIRSRSPKPIQLFIMSKCYNHANLLKSASWLMRYCAHKPFWLKFGSLSPTVTLKIGHGHQNQISSSSCSNVISMQIWLKFANQFMRYGAHKHFLA